MASFGGSDLANRFTLVGGSVLRENKVRTRGDDL
jgi:hypothetical protein